MKYWSKGVKSILKKPAESVAILFDMVVLHSNPSILCEIEQARALKEEHSIHDIIKPNDVAFCPIERITSCYFSDISYT